MIRDFRTPAELLAAGFVAVPRPNSPGNSLQLNELVGCGVPLHAARDDPDHLWVSYWALELVDGLRAAPSLPTVARAVEVCLRSADPPGMANLLLSTAMLGDWDALEAELYPCSAPATPISRSGARTVGSTKSRRRIRRM
jgi:hypothetical protein